MMLPMKYPVGTRISGKVRNLTSFGAFVEIEPGIDGLIHISDMSWTKRVQHPSEIVKKGDSVEVVILNIDPENKRISLGLKQLEDDPWLSIAETHPVGMEMEGKIVRYQDNGIVVDLDDDIEGFVPQSQLPLPAGKSAEQVTVVGQGVALKVLEVDPIHHRIILAATEFLEKPPEPEPVEETSPDAGAEPAEPAAEDEAQPAASEAAGADTESPPADAKPEAESPAEDAKPEAESLDEDAKAEAESPAEDAKAEDDKDSEPKASAE
jgi:small subunit ribosomal protein S1